MTGEHHDHFGIPLDLLPEPPPESSGRRRAVAGWVLGAGLAALALAFPQERLLGQQVARSALGLESFADALHVALRWVVERATGLGAEPAGFVLSAVAYGACLPIALSVAKRSALSLGSSLAASLAVLLSPVAWVAGTSPGPAALGLCFSLLLLGALWQRERPAAGAAAGLWALAAWCAPVSIWVLPAAAWAIASGVRGRPRAALGVAAVGVAWLGLLVLLGGSEAQIPRVVRAALFGGSGGWGQILAWGAGLVPGLGLAALAAAGLFLLRRHEAESPPPRWLRLWCLLPLFAAVLGGSPTWEIPYLWILPPALIGALDLLSRLEGRRSALLALGAVAAQMALLVGVLAVLSSTDPLAPWRSRARETLRPGDLVLTTRADHAYLLEERWGVEARRVDASDSPGAFHAGGDPGPWVALAGKAVASGRRVVFDTDVLAGRWSTFEPLVQELGAAVPLVRLEAEARGGR